METKIVSSIQEVLGLIDITIILLCYGGSTLYNLMFIRKAVWTDYSWIKAALAFCCTLFFLIFSYVFVMTLLRTPVTQEFFGTVVIRTAISWLGIALFFASKARYTTLMHGGEKWILKL